MCLGPRNCHSNFRRVHRTLPGLPSLSSSPAEAALRWLLVSPSDEVNYSLAKLQNSSMRLRPCGTGQVCRYLSWPPMCFGAIAQQLHPSLSSTRRRTTMTWNGWHIPTTQDPLDVLIGGLGTCCTKQNCIPPTFYVCKQVRPV